MTNNYGCKSATASTTFGSTIATNHTAATTFSAPTTTISPTTLTPDVSTSGQGALTNLFSKLIKYFIFYEKI